MSNIEKRRKEDGLWHRVWAVVRRFFVVIGISVTFSIVMIGISVSQLKNSAVDMPEKILLTYTFSGEVGEVVTAPSLSNPLLRPAVVLQEIITALDDGAKDTRVTGLLVRLQDPQLNLAQVQELRDAITRFRKAGKFAYVYSDSYGGGGGMGDYYLASAFEQIWLQPVGAVAINGIGAQVPFFKTLFDKVGVKADFVHKGIYKSAPESLTETQMTAPTRMMTTEMIKDLSGQIISGIAENRGLTADQVRSFIDQSPYNETDALRLKLVDKIGYLDEVLAAAKEKTAGPDEDAVDLESYIEAMEDTHPKKSGSEFMAQIKKHEKAKKEKSTKVVEKNKIAIVYGVGDIVAHSEKSGGGMAATKVAAAFKLVQKDEAVAAVVFRIDSPGGEPSAAETIRRAMLQTKANGIPIIVSMGGYAASGGYWIASAADKIVAQPATLTGSIGVFGGKFVAAGLFEKIGVNFETISEGKNAAMWSSTATFTPEQRAKFDSMMGDIYDAFLTRVAEGRHMKVEQVQALAQGRVWTGAQAKENGLVDELGGLEHAISLAKAQAKLDPAKEVFIEDFPPRKSTLELFLSMASEGNVSLAPSFKIDVQDILRSVTATDVLKTAPMVVR